MKSNPCPSGQVKLSRVTLNRYAPDAAALCVVVEHPVPLLPDNVLGLLPHDVLHHALELDGGALVVEDPVLHLLVALVHNFYSWHYKMLFQYVNVFVYTTIIYIVVSGLDRLEQAKSLLGRFKLSYFEL